MKKHIFLVAILMAGLCLLNMSCSKKELPIIKATSLKVDIKDGDYLIKNAWRITPELNPDIYTTSSNNVTFYTDIDSINFKIKPGKAYDFIILLNEKDTAYTQIQYKSGYLDVLKNAAEYNYKDERYIPEFTYKEPDDENLVRLRELYNLDSIAGEAGEISQIINLMYWVHGIVRHDGSSFNPEKKNAIDLITVCQKENRGINCRMMATILNECYLAMGMLSRFVTCMPKETEFDDCHVINMVYSNELEKWLWMDPTFCAYVMNEKGVLLSISEVRERLIHDRPLIINPDANWNRVSPETKEEYLDYYMAKNLYRMQCPLKSENDTETYREGKDMVYIELLPLDGFEQEPQKDEDVRETYTLTNYKTNNPDKFWSKPVL